MKRIATVMAAATLGVAVTGAIAPAAFAATCTGKAPTALSFTRAKGHTSGVLHWKAPAVHPAGASYRTLRNGAVIGQTKMLQMAIRVTAGNTYVFGVRVVAPSGAVSPCHNSIKRTVTYYKPTAPKTSSLQSRTSDAITIGWGAGAGGDARLTAYRILRNGTVVGQTTKRTYKLSNLFSSTNYTITVKSVDSRGEVSAGTSPAVKTATLAPTPTTGTAHAFILASTDKSFEDFRSHYKRFGVVYPTYYDCLSNNTITGKNDTLITGWAQARKVLVMPRINCQSQTVLHDFLNNSTDRSAILTQLVNLVQDNGYDGLNIDFESGQASDRDALTSFIQTLASDLHANGKKLTVCVAAAYYNQLVGRQGFYDYKALGSAADYVFVMGWGYHWATSAPGSIDDITWENRVVSYVDTMPLKSKYILGLGMYGMDWPDGGGATNRATALEYGSIRALMQRMDATPVMDHTSESPHFSYTEKGVNHDVWYQNATSLGTRIALAGANGLHVGFWHLGEEDPALWNNNKIK